MKLAWIGLGNMGVPMVRNLAAGTEAVKAYNRSGKSVDVGAATVVSTVEDAVGDADITFLMVSDGPAVKDLLFGEQNLAALAKPGSLIVNMSTIGVEETHAIAERLGALGLDYMDAPVSGSVKPAVDGTLVVLAGANPDTYQRVEPLLMRMAKASFYLGPVGSGTAMKLLVNAFLGVIMQVTAECMTAADKVGFGREQLLEVLSQTAVWAPVLGAKKEMWKERSYPAAFALRHMSKDLGLMTQFANTLGVPTPAIMSTMAMFLSANEDGHAEEDMAAITEHMTALAGLR